MNNHDDVDNYIIERLSEVLVASENPDKFVSVHRLARLFGVSYARALDCSLDAHFTDDPDRPGMLRARWRWPL